MLVCERNYVMQVLNQQHEALKSDLSGIVKSNLGTSQKGSNIERLRNGATGKIESQVVYFECPPIRNLTIAERESLLKTTLRMGNQMFYNAEKENLNPNFSHEYSLRYIEVTEEMVNEIEKYSYNSVYSESSIIL